MVSSVEVKYEVGNEPKLQGDIEELNLHGLQQLIMERSL